MKEPSIKLIMAFLRYSKIKKLAIAEKDYDPKLLKKLQNEMVIKGVNFRKIRKTYYNLLGND